ncbi:Thiol-specific monooxygenase [Fusarium austroafricanum]|uniref:Thiol-specific monooxygenase n=1 Tax=Fusarium austroafricanum TaxID=2364996 RepID=A0A8H4K4D8_9HYPO|nr:Thiol-specific monooxygenase [Fusarium austroafricanum]
MSFSDKRFPHGPFVSHQVPRQYLQDYYSLHQMENLLVLNTTVEDVSKIATQDGQDRWRLTLRKYDAARQVDEWRQEIFDAVIVANGQFSVPYVPEVKGLKEYMERYPSRVMHSKNYRNPLPFKDKQVLIVGNALSGRDIAEDLLRIAQLPVYVSRRHKSRWEGSEPDEGIQWKPVIKEYLASTGQILFEDGSSLDTTDRIIYCTGYKPSFPFWNAEANGKELYDYDKAKLNGSFLHTFFRDHPTLGIIGFGQTLAFRSYEYQAIALARVFARRNAVPLASPAKQEEWEKSWEEYTKREGYDFHTVPFEDGELFRWYSNLSNIAGLSFCGKGRVPPAFTEEAKWQLENIRRFDEPAAGIIAYKEKTKATS